jgi:hypothetical protein
MARQRSIFSAAGRRVRVGGRVVDKDVVFDFLMGRRDKWKPRKTVRRPMPMGVRKRETGRVLAVTEDCNIIEVTP